MSALIAASAGVAVSALWLAGARLARVPAGSVLGGPRIAAPVAGPAQESPVWRQAIVADLSAAEALLDELEAAGLPDRELSVLENAAFAVRWRSRATPAARRQSLPA